MLVMEVSFQGANHISGGRGTAPKCNVSKVDVRQHNVP